MSKVNQRTWVGVRETWNGGGLRVEFGRRTGPEPRSVERPLFSIVTVCLNCADHLEYTLGRLREVDFEDFEHLVIDGASNDGTLEVARRFSEQIDYCMSAPDEGVSDAFNRGASLARGRYIAFLNAGDAYVPEALSAVAAAIKDGADLIYGSSYKSDPVSGEPLEFVRARPWRRKYAGTPFRHSAVFASADLFEAVRPFDTGYRFAMDIEFFYKAFERANRIVCLDTIISHQRVGGLSHRNYLRALEEYYRINCIYSGRSALFLRMVFLRALLGRFAGALVKRTRAGRWIRRKMRGRGSGDV